MKLLTRRLLIFVSILIIFQNVETLPVNVALNKVVQASNTCGQYGDEMYNLNSEIDLSSSNRQEITCQDGITHSPQYIVDGDVLTSWQSASRFLIYLHGDGNPTDHREATIMLDLAQLFQVQTIVLDMSESIRPDRIAIWKSDDGTNYTPWLYKVTLQSDCQTFFNVETTDVPKADTFTICTKFSNVDPAIINQKIEFDVSKGDYSFQTARYLRISFFEMGFLLGVSGNSFQHYTLRELEVKAECSCFGHEIACEQNNGTGSFECVCGENTMGSYCDLCQPLFNQKSFQSNIPCEACNCFDHATECRYDATVDAAKLSLNAAGVLDGGGVCIGCQDNTTGNNCESCLNTYYRGTGSVQTDPCVACVCSIIGAANEACVKDSASAPVNMQPGDCFCKTNVEGMKCDTCKPGFYDLTSDNIMGCKDCLCEVAGCQNSNIVCNGTGQCPCKANVQGRMCDTCKDGFFQLSQDNVDGCAGCGCDIGGVSTGGCDKITGQCSCLGRVTGRQCDSIVDGSYYPDLHYIFAEAETPTGNIGDNTANAGFTGYGYAILNPNERLVVTLNIPTKVPGSQQFSLVVRYKASVQVTGTVSIIGLVEVSSVVFPACSTNWCYLQVGGAQLFSLTPSLSPYTVSIQQDGSFLVDRIVAIPTEFLVADILGANGQTFKDDCHVLENGQNIAVDKQALCSGQIYSVVTKALSGGQTCDCSAVGSISTVCNKVGGQCPCRPGVGGRKCDQCLPDHSFLSLDGCRPCNCAGTNKLCDSFSGQCYCTSTTIGPTCDTCANLHYDWTANGCTACACGVGSRNFQCNTTNGVCDCHVGVTGDKCDQCAEEYKDLSSTGCVSCGCDSLGSTSPICNKTSGQCPCKENVVGLLCNQCSGVSYNLDVIHPKGCADCVCMGITQSCDSSQWYLQQVKVPLLDEINPNRSSLINIVDKQRADSGMSVIGERQPVEPILIVNLDGTQELFWNIDYTGMIGNVLGMYGSFLEFDLSYSTLEVGGQFQPLQVLLLNGNEQLVHKIPSTLEFNISNPIRIQLIEGSFQTSTGDVVTREKFLMALTQVQAWLLPASLINLNHETTLSNLVYTIGTTNRLIGERAIHVEQCACGQGYTGSSCENCASGYKRVNASSQGFLGFCEPCTCNGHSNECDPDTGICLNCRQNTLGDSCEVCLAGFYGDATAVAGCTACSCFSPRVSDANCEIINGTLTCLNCNQGYMDPFCNKCKPFYYGQPQVINTGTCTACNCNGNSNECNPQTGVCLNCASNTGGDNCENCLDGFYGNATNKDCQECGCDAAGSFTNSLCDPASGQCQCLFGVGERACNQCKPEFWGYSDPAFEGCKECLCNSEGSENLQCSEAAICPCKPNVSGDKCDTCASGFWGLPNLPCTACACDATGSVDVNNPCDGQTGQCGCKPGVTGRQCDTCQLLYTGFSANGCTKCGQCEDSLGNDTVLLEEKFNMYWLTVSDISLIQDQDQRLQRISQDLTTAQADLGFSDLTTLNTLLTDLASKQITYTTEVNALQTRLEVDVVSSSVQYNDTLQELNRFQVLVTESSTAKTQSEAALTTSSGYVTELSGYKTKADSLLQSPSIRVVSSNLTFTSEKTAVDSELVLSQTVSTQVNAVKVQLDGQNVALVTEEDRDRRLEGEMTAIQTLNSQIQANITSLQTQKAPIDQSLGNLQSQLTTAEILMNDTMSKLASANIQLQSSTQSFSQGQGTLNDCALVLGDNPTRLPLPLNTTVDISSIVSYPSAYQSLSSSVDQTTQNIQTARGNSATLLASNLQTQAQALQNDFNSVVALGQEAVNAKTNYETAVASLTESLTQAQNASQVVSQQSASLSGVNLINLETTANSSSAQSDSLLNEVNSRNYQPQVLESQLLSANTTLQNSVTEWANLVASLDAVTAEAQALDTGGSFTNTLNQAETNSQLIQSRTQRTRNNDQSLLGSLASLTSESLLIQNQSEQAVSITAVINSKVVNFENSQKSTESFISTNNIVYNQIDILKPNITSRLNDLEAKIIRARQLAERLRQPVSFTNDGTTANKPVVSPNSLSNSIELCNKINLEFKTTTSSSGLLFFMENSETASEFSLELASGSVVFHFTINFERVQMTSPAEIIDNEWFRVEASRCANSGQVTVTRVSTGGTAVSHRAGVSLNARTMVLSSNLYFGGLPTDYVTNKVSSTGFVGCIYNVWYGEQQIPIWQIRVNSGEAECCRKPLYYNPIPTIPGTEMSGFGHLQLSPPAFNSSFPTEFSLQFRTFKSNGVLFIMENQLGNVYYGAFLFSGTVIFTLKTLTDSYTIQSADTYNDGQWYMVSTRLNATRLEMVLKYGVNGSFFDKENLQAETLAAPDLSVLQNRPITFGSVNPQPIPVSTPTRDRFSGYLSGFQFLSPGDSSLTTQLLDTDVVSESGVYREVPAKILSGLSLYTAQSYAQLRVTSTRTVESISLFFSTFDPDGVLFYSISSSSQDILIYIAVNHGNIVLYYNDMTGGTLKGPLQTSGLYLSDGVLHHVEVKILSSLRVQLKVDDITIEDNVKVFTSSIFLGTGSVYLGGVPDSVQLGAMFPVKNTLIAGINTLSVNTGEIDLLNEALYVSQVGVSIAGIASSRSSPVLPPYTIPDSTTVLTSCLSPAPSATYSDAGVRFGDTDVSYQTHTLSPEQMTALTNSFVLTIKFRSYVSDGTLFYVANQPMDPTLWFSVYLEGGFITVSMSSSTNNPNTIRLQSQENQYNNGSWWEVDILRINDFLAIVVSNQKDYKNNAVQSSTASSLTFNTPVFIGGLDSTVTGQILPAIQIGKTPLTGCILKVEITPPKDLLPPFLLDLKNPATDGGTARCFSNAVPGVRMSGVSSYLQISPAGSYTFQVPFLLSVSIRTVVRSGNLLTIYQSDSQFVVLDLYQGQIRCMIGNAANKDNPLIVTAEEPTNLYTLCNNEAHLLRLEITASQLTIQVDQTTPQVYQFPTGFTLPSIQGFFTVAGLHPDQVGSVTFPVSASLSSFTGCLEGLTINGQYTDPQSLTITSGINYGCFA